ncbi:MAG: molybdenum cofactor biosynthesis protein MoaE [Gemmatimonadota bacterium]
MIHASVQTSPIVPETVLAQVGSDQDGAVLLFLGMVRNHADGRAVRGMYYDAYEAMAVPVLREIATEASARLGSDRVAVAHRTGDLAIGDISVAIAVSSPHRAEAYEASRYVIEEIKKRLPVWKREHYVDGEEAWVEGTVPPGGGAPPHRASPEAKTDIAAAARGGTP